MSLVDKKGSLNRSLIIMALFLVLFSLITLGAVKEQGDVTLTYKVDSGVRRDSVNESGVQLTFNVRPGTIPHVFNESGVILDLMQTVLPPTITDTRNLFNFSSLKTEVVWTALSLVLNNTNGTIDFETTIDLSNVPVLDLDKHVNISYNYIEINGSAITQFNTSAKLTLSNLTFSNVRVLKDGSDCTECTIVSYSYNNLVFTAPGFTIYRAADGAVVPAIRISTRINVTNATMNITGDTYNSSYPANVTIDLGNDGIVEWNFTGQLNATEQNITNLADSLNSLIRDCGCSGCNLSSNGLTCTIDIGINSETQGTVELSDLNISQVIRNASWERGTSYTLIDLDDYFYDQNGDTLNYTSEGNENISVSISEGIVSLSAGNWYGKENVTFYANDSLNITKSNNVTLTVIYAAVCGDTSCEAGLGETCDNCEADCGTCGGPPPPPPPPDPCDGVSCSDSTTTCWDGSTATCSNSCSDGSCSSCTPTCPADPCDDVTCDPITDTCWDGSTAECTPSCSAGDCGTCTPECPACVEDWVCTDWSSCAGGTQTRSCTDQNSCGTTVDKPEESQDCVGCSTAADCDDSDSCTTDSCDSGVCQNAAIVCEDSTTYCEQTDEWISCENSCEGGLCGDCSSTLECTVDVCYGYECVDVDVSCPDGSTVSCSRVCEDVGAAQCSACDPDELCTDPCLDVVCNDYCSGGNLYDGGSCDAGSCVGYSETECEFGCSGGECKDESLVEELPEVTIAETFRPGTDVNQVPCVNVTKWATGKSLEMKTADISGVYDVPEGYEIIMDPFDLNCGGDSLDLTLSIPENYIDVQAIKCSGGICAPTSVTKVTKLVCGDSIVKEWRTEEKFTPELASINVKPVNVTLSNIKKTLQSGNTKVKFVGEALENITASLSVEEEPQPRNPSLRIIGAPLTLKLGKAVETGTTITMPYALTKEFDENSIAMYARIGDDWNYIGGKVNKDRKTVITNIKDISKYIDEDNEMHLALMAVICVNCLESNLEKVYEPEGGSRDAIVLVHGLASSPETYKDIIDDIRLTNQPFQTWTFGYPSDTAVAENAKEFAEQLELHSNEYDRVYIIAHSLGGIITQKALYDSFNENKEVDKYSYLDKVQKVVLVGVPNEGSPGAEVYRNLFKDLINKKTSKTLFNPNSPVIDELVKGTVTPRVPGIDYYVIAGTKSYEFDLVFFRLTSETLFEEGVRNDGLVSVYSAQNVGGDYINDMCEDYWELNVTHSDLIEHSLARRLIEQIIAQEILKLKEGEAVLGANKYFELSIDACSPEDKYIIIGKKIDRAELYDVTGCLCGNGVCGVGENALNCPADCAVFFSKERIYYFLVYLLLIPLLLVVAAFAYREYRILRLPFYVRRELTEFDVLLRAANKYLRAGLLTKAAESYKRLRVVYVDLVKASLGKRKEKRLYSKVKDVYSALKKYEVFRSISEKELMEFDVLYYEAKGYIEDNVMLKAAESYNKLRKIYVELVNVHLGLFKEYEIYRKVKEVYKLLRKSEKEYIKERLEGFNEGVSRAKELIKGKNIGKASKAYNELKTEYVDLVRLKIGLFREYGIYSDIKEIYGLLKNLKKKGVDKRLEKFGSLKIKAEKLIDEENLKEAADAYKILRTLYVDLVKLGIGKSLYRDVKEVYESLKELKKDDKLERFEQLTIKVKELIKNKEIRNALVSYTGLKGVYVELVNVHLGLFKEYEIYRKVKEVYKLLRKSEKEYIKEKLEGFNEGVSRAKELIEGKNIVKASKAYNELKTEYVDLVKLGIGKSLYRNIKDVYRLLNKGKIECVRENRLMQFDLLYYESKGYIEDKVMLKAAESYNKLNGVYVELVKEGIGRKHRLHKKVKEIYRLLEELRGGIRNRTITRIVNKTKDLISKGEIKKAASNYKKLNYMYAELIKRKIGFVNKHRIYKDVKEVYRLLQKNQRVNIFKEAKIKEFNNLYRRTKNCIEEGMIEDAKKNYKKLRAKYIHLANVLGIRRYYLYFKMKSVYRKLK